jgi:hypothetical protein
MFIKGGGRNKARLMVVYADCAINITGGVIDFIKSIHETTKMVKDFSKLAAFSDTCIGAYHLKTGKPCQDYSSSWASGTTAVAVAEGLPWDDRCYLSQTTSLCDEDAISLFRHYYEETLPLAIFLGSDGVDDSFPMDGNEEHLGYFYYVLLENFLKHGIKKSREELQEMLPLLTQKGSGDDISIAGIISSQ